MVYNIDRATLRKYFVTLNIYISYLSFKILNLLFDYEDANNFCEEFIYKCKSVGNIFLSYTGAEGYAYLNNKYDIILVLAFYLLILIFILDIIFRKKIELAISEYKNYFYGWIFIVINANLFFEYDIDYGLYSFYILIYILMVAGESSIIFTLTHIARLIGVVLECCSTCISKILEKYFKIITIEYIALLNKPSKRNRKFFSKEYLDKRLSKNQIVLFDDREEDVKELNSIIRAVKKDGLKGYSIGISGDWGMGKTYFLRSFVEREYANSYIWVTPSIFVRKEDLYTEIVKGFEEVFKANKLYSSKSDNIGGYLSDLIDLFRESNITTSRFFNRDDGKTFDEIKKNLDKYVERFLFITGKPIVVVIDDFDRLFHFIKDNQDNNENINKYKNEEAEILQIIYELTNIKGVVVLYSVKEIENYTCKKKIASDDKVKNELEDNLYYKKYINRYITLKNINIEQITRTIFKTGVFQFKDIENKLYKDLKLDVDCEKIIIDTLNFFYKNKSYVNVRSVENIIRKFHSLLNVKVGDKLIENELDVKVISAFAIIQEVYILEYEKILKSESFYNFDESNLNSLYNNEIFENINNLINYALEINDEHDLRLLYGNGTGLRLSEIKLNKLKIINRIFLKEDTRKPIEIFKKNHLQSSFNAPYYRSVKNIIKQLELINNAKISDLGIDGVFGYFYQIDEYPKNIVKMSIDEINQENFYKIIYLNKLIIEELKKVNSKNDITSKIAEKFIIDYHDSNAELINSGSLEYDFVNKIGLEVRPAKLSCLYNVKDDVIYLIDRESEFDDLQYSFNISSIEKIKGAFEEVVIKSNGADRELYEVIGNSSDLQVKSLYISYIEIQVILIIKLALEKFKHISINDNI